jgi:MFS family permease
MIFSTGMAILTSVFPPGERGRALGLTVAAVYTGLSIGPPVGGAITQHLGWRWIFHANFGMGLVVLWIVLVRLRGEWKVDGARRYDLAGAVLYGAGLACALYGLATLNASTRGGPILAGGAVLLAGFVLRELRFPEPLLDLGLFRNGVFAFSNLAALIHYSATFGVALVLSWYLQGVRGLDPQTAGLVLLCQPVMMALVSPLAGRLSDRFEPRLIASAGMAITCVGVFLLAPLHRHTPVPWVMADLLFIGFGYAFFSSPNTNAIMSSVERSRYGVASAAVGTMRLIGQATSMAIVTFLFALYLKGGSGPAMPVPELLKSQRTCYLLFGVLCFAGVFASLARGRVRN